MVSLLCSPDACCSELQPHCLSAHCRVVFNEVVQTSKYYMRDVTAVESSWLVELAPHFYKQAKVGLWTSREVVGSIIEVSSVCWFSSTFSMFSLLSFPCSPWPHVLHVSVGFPPADLLYPEGRKNLFLQRVLVPPLSSLYS